MPVKELLPMQKIVAPNLQQDIFPPAANGLRRRLLDVVDMQYDFVMPDGLLAVAGADKLIDPTNEFFRSVPHGWFNEALFKLDTHFVTDKNGQPIYAKTPEAVPFPTPHCVYGSKGWELVVKPDLLPLAASYMTKDEFDMWAPAVFAQNPPDVDGYANLGKITTQPQGSAYSTSRDLWFKFQLPPVLTEVVMIGVASDYCVLDAAKGYVARGYKLTLIRDLTAGIGGDAQRGGPDIDDVIAKNFPAELRSGQVRVVGLDEYVAEMHGAPSRPKATPSKDDSAPTL